MQKKKARKGFLFLRRESVLPPCRAGPVCPAGTNAVFCGGTHGSRPTRCGGHTGRTESSAPTHLVIARQSAPRSKCPWGTDWRGNPFPARQRRADGTSRTPSPTHSVIASQSAGWRGHWLGMTARQRPLDKPAGMGIIVLERKYEKHVCHPMSYQLAKTVTWQSGGFCQIAPLDKPGEMGIIVNRRGRCDKRSAP